MQGYNVLMIYNKDIDRLLMCKRLKNPLCGDTTPQACTRT